MSDACSKGSTESLPEEDDDVPDHDALSDSESRIGAPPCGDISNTHFYPSLYEQPDALVPLYEGAEVTLLEAITQHFDWFTAHPGTSKQALSHILHMQNSSILLAGNHLPSSYDAALKIIDPFLIQPVTFHACILFRNDYSDSISCPNCQAPRYKHGTVPAKKFSYLPIRPRLERIFGTSKLFQIVQAHAHSVESDNCHL